MRLGPYWATYIWTSELDIPDLVSTYDNTIQVTTIVPSFICTADTVAKLRVRQLGRNRHNVAWSAKLLSPNAEIVSRFNSVILADRRLKIHPIITRKPGAKSRKLHSELEPEVVLAAILAKNRKSRFF